MTWKKASGVQPNGTRSTISSPRPFARKLVLVGGGGTSADVLAIIAAINATDPRYEVMGLLDDALPAGSKRWQVPVLGGLADHASIDDAWYVDCLGSPRSFRGRQALYQRIGLDPSRFETIVHPSATLAVDAILGAGSIVYPNAVVLSGVTVGSHVTILANTVLNHETVIGDWSILASGVMVSGAVRIGVSCYLGVGSLVREGISIGDGALIAMGSAVISDVASGATVGGVPARPLRSRS